MPANASAAIDNQWKSLKLREAQRHEWDSKQVSNLHRHQKKHRLRHTVLCGRPQKMGAVCSMATTVSAEQHCQRDDLGLVEAALAGGLGNPCVLEKSVEFTREYVCF